VAEERIQVGTSNETAEIKGEIERTRVEMSETIGEIQDRLRPDHLMQQARDGVTQAAAGKVKDIMSSAGETASTVATRARGAGDYVADYAKAHPIRIAVAIGAVTWWMLRGSDRSDDWYGTADTSWDDSEAMSYGDGGSRRNRLGEYASTARDTVGEYASTARGAVGEYASSARAAVGEYADSARESARYASERVRTAASSATTTADQWVRENPLAAGAIALAVGAAIGMSVPATEIENRTMGETRDQAWERARQAAANLKDNVTKKVENVAGNLVGDSLMGNGESGSSGEPMGRA